MGGVAGLMLTIVCPHVSANLYQLQQSNGVCANRGGAGGGNHFSKNVGAGNVAGCASYVQSVVDCGFAFNYNPAHGWCDCVPESVGACNVHVEAGTEVYHFPLLMEVQQQHKDSVCANRGGAGGSSQFSSNVGANNLAGCVSYIKTIADCGFAFNYAPASGWCDCVPESVGACNVHSEAGTLVYHFPVLTEVLLQHKDSYCANRGGNGGANQFTTDVGTNNLVGCVSFVKGVADCGFAFNYDPAGGWCDCVPASTGACQVASAANYRVYHFSTTTTTTTITSTMTPNAMYLIKNSATKTSLVFNATKKGLESNFSCAAERWRIQHVGVSSVTLATHMGEPIGWRFMGHIGGRVWLAPFGGPSFTWSLAGVGNETYTIRNNVEDDFRNTYLALSPTGQLQLRDSVDGNYNMWIIPGLA